MFALKQFIKPLLLSPVVWLVPLVLVLVFWKRRWARPLQIAAIALVYLSHAGWLATWLDGSLESRHAPLVDPRRAEPYDAIVVLAGGAIPAGHAIPFDTLGEAMFHRVEEAARLYQTGPRPVIMSGGDVVPFSEKRENAIACSYLVRLGVRPADLISEPDSRDTFENAVAVGKILAQHGWRRYLLVTSARHMPRSLQVFRRLAPEPIPAPADFTVRSRQMSLSAWIPTEVAASAIRGSAHEYLGMLQYSFRLRSVH